MGVTDNFFYSKKPWSTFKDGMLGWYLKPYIYKLLWTKKRLYIIDCFAGKGMFDDGKEGSPIIIAKHIQEILQRGESKNKEVYGIFIERKYSKDLTNNLNGYKNCKAYSGCFEDYIDKICNAGKNGNVFLYIDPYGIKSLKFQYLERICSSSCIAGNSIEMFINFNSNGFIREACRLLKYKIDDKLVEEYQSSYEIQDISEQYLTETINSNKWKDYIKAYYKKQISYHDMEKRIVAEYLKSLKQRFAYCLNIPIKNKEKNIPKYRMIFCTNSKDGLLLMNEKMHDTLEMMREQELEGQISLFGLPEIQDVKGLEEYINKVLSEVNEIDYGEFVCDIIKETNIVYTEKHIRQKLKEMEKKNLIEVSRVPKDGSIPGRKLSGWNCKANVIKIRLLQKYFVTNEGAM